jgi:predicted MPP superfamily phosphohydrolase
MTAKKKKLIIILAFVVIALIAFISWIIWGNTALQLNTYRITSSRLPEAFNGYRIAQISDLHNAEMGKQNEKLFDILKEAKPDIIAITGDLIDSRHTNIAIALDFAAKAVNIAPCYYVTGNHEARISEYDDFKNSLIKLGVVVLDDEQISIELGDDSITLIGVNDPSFQTNYLFGDDETVMESTLQELTKDSNDYKVLLSHRLELFELYASYDIDLILSGHAHVGQFRLPVLGGVLVPNQGFFPKYDAGLYTKDNTNMIVSRGIGNSAFPFRFNNRPEVVLIELQG